MALRIEGTGPLGARVLLVGEAPGFDEEIAGKPFVGASGKELDKQLDEVGIKRSECYVTNVCQYRPPDNMMSEWITEKKTDLKKGYVELNGKYVHRYVVEGRDELYKLIESMPNLELVIGFGNTPLWALTGNWGVTNWRGSEMVLEGGGILRPIHFVPTFHPAAILRNFAQRPQVIHDLSQRCAKRLRHGFITPDFKFNIQPTFDEVMACIEGLTGDVVGDIETAAGRTICLGLAWSKTEAICIPFRGPDGVCFSVDEVRAIFEALKKKRSQITWIGQNWNYDAQYIQEDFCLHLMADFDTYVAQSVLFPGVERSLGFLSSMYCEWHQYWKEDAKDWGRISDFNGLFRYNCRDCCANWEVAQAQKILLEKARLTPQFEERMKYSRHVYHMMVTGVNKSPERSEKMIRECDEAIHERELFLSESIGRPVIKETKAKITHMFNSPKQVADLFYKELGCKAQMKRGKGKEGKVTTDDDALKKVMEEYPQHAPLALAILECRSLDKLKSTFLEAESDPDGKFRSSWMATGTETFRCTSGGNAFHRGGPLQNVTKGDGTHSGRKLPNLRSCIVPSYGHTIFNCDLERADLQVVVWEANDEDLKQKMREHADIHSENAKDVFGLDRKPTEQERHFGKTFVHLTDYGGTARTCAVKIGCTVHEADLAQKRWFKAHPGIKQWHQRVQAGLMAYRTVTNRYGYRRIYFDRIESVLPQALAWVPQSTVSILISLIQMAMDEATNGEAPIIMQGHDSVIGEYLTAREEIILPKLYAASKIAVPYDDPLYIPLELATSTDSWGEVEKRPWPTITSVG